MDVIDVLGEVLQYAIGVAVSPVPIAAVIVILFTPKAKTNAPAFLIGWILGMLAVGSVVLLIPGMEASDSEPSTQSGIVKAMLGLALLFVGWRLWQKRPRSGETAEAPAWMDSIDMFGVGKSLGMGFLLSAVNPKNLLLVAAAGVAISASDLSAGEQLAVLIVFTLIAASTVAVPVIGYLIARERADETFAAAKTWLIQNNSIVMAVLMLVFGISLIGDAVQILL